jgi:UDP-N-acetylmuramate dehydrogenase
MDKKLIQKIRKNVSGKILQGEPLARHTTYRVGGRAEVLVCPCDAEDAARAYSIARGEGIPLVVIGAGSNVIAPDEGIDGIVLSTISSSARILYLGGGRVRADAGVPLSDLVRATAARGLSGLEPLAGIPGTVGGAIVMNAGTRDTETAEYLRRVEVLTSTGRSRMFAAAECSLGYRRSIFLGTDWFILGAEFKLRRGKAAANI